MKWLDGIANTMVMNLSKLQEIGEPGMPQSMELQRPEHYLVNEQQQSLNFLIIKSLYDS